MKNIYQLIFIGVVSILMASCYYDDVPETVAIPDGTVVTYVNDIGPMLSGCTTCHGGTVTPDFRNTQAAYNGLFPNYVTIGNPAASKLYYFAPGSSTSGHASVGVSLTATQLATMKYWINHEAKYE